MQAEQRRDALIQMRVNDAERKASYEAADSACLTASEYFRRAALGRIIPVIPPRHDRLGISLLRQCAGLVKQIFRKELADRDLTWETLTRIKEAVKRLRLSDDQSKVDEFHPSSEPRTIIIQISLLEDERKQIMAAARRHGVSVSEFVREAAIRRRPGCRVSVLDDEALERIRECGRKLKALCLGNGSAGALKEMLALAEEVAG